MKIFYISPAVAKDAYRVADIVNKVNYKEKVQEVEKSISLIKKLKKVKVL